MSKPIDVSIIIPAFNEELIIKDTLHKLADYVTKNKTYLGTTEVVVVVAGSDRTASIAESSAHLFDSLSVVTFKRRVGKGRDVRAGFAKARGAVQLFMDADLSVPLHHVSDMVRELRSEDFDVVIGARNLSKIHKGVLRSMLSVATNLLTRTVILPRTSDTQCGFKGFTRAAAETIFKRQKINDWGFDIEVLVLAREAGLTVQELKIKDWHETRTDELHGSTVSGAALTSLVELAQIRVAAWGRWCRKPANLAPLIAAFTTFGVAFFVGPFSSIWFDEAYSAALIKHPLGELIHLTSVDVHPPLYYLALKGWAAIFGHSDFALRSLSMVFGALASGVAIKLTRYMFGVRAALIMVPFVVFAPMLLRYDVEARMYAMVSLICILATYVLVRALDAKKRSKVAWWTVYAVLVALGMYTQYYAALIWVAHFIWCLYVSKPRSFGAFIKQPWLHAYIGAVILFIPWIYSFIWQLINVQGGFWIAPATIREILNLVTMMLSYQQQWQETPHQSLITMVGIGAALWFIVSAWRQVAGPQKRYFVLLALYSVIPVILLFVVSLPPLKPVFFDRYFSLTLIGAYMLVGAAVAIKAKSYKSWLAAGAIVLVLVGGVGSLYAQKNYVFNTLTRPRAKEVAQYLHTQDTSKGVIIADTSGQYLEYIHYIDAPNFFFLDTDHWVNGTGGLAMLQHSPQLLKDGQTVVAPTIWYLYYDKEPRSPILADYTLTKTIDIDKYKLGIYRHK